MDTDTNNERHIRITRIYLYRTKMLSGDRLPARLFTTIWDEIPERYRDNHIVVEALVTENLSKARVSLFFSDGQVVIKRGWGMTLDWEGIKADYMRPVDLEY